MAVFDATFALANKKAWKYSGLYLNIKIRTFELYDNGAALYEVPIKL